ncbi:MAG: hypothetical protein ACM31C_03440 [Acidobacteriota bacterium]
MKLKDLEKRLEKEPGNLGLKVTVAGLMHEAGRTVEAVELYRAVALAYRDSGRKQQAIVVCRSILEIAPEDEGCRALLAALVQPASPPPPPVTPGAVVKRRSSVEPTPLPTPVPHHVADPTSGAARISPHDLDLPTSEGADTKPGSEPKMDSSGLAEAARRISGWISADEDDLAAELETRQRPRLPPAELERLAQPPPTVPTEKVELAELEDDDLTPLRESADITRPRTKLPEKK